MKKRLYIVIWYFMIVTLLSATTVFVWGNADFSKTAAESVDVQDYLEQYSQLVGLLDMQPVKYWQFPESDSYMKDQFYLEMYKDMYSMKNEGASYIQLFGINLGDSIITADDALMQAGWVEHYKTEGQHDYISILNGNRYVLSITVGSDGLITSWYLNNWPQGEEVANDFERLERNQQLDGNNPTEEWKQAYVDFVDSMHEKLQYESSGAVHVINEIYKLVDINGDEIPELYINTGSTAGGDYICTYAGGEVVEQYVWNYGFSYIEGQNLFRDSGGHMDVYYDKIYSLKDGAFVLIASGEYGAEDNSDVQMDENGNFIYDYRWNGQAVSSEEEYMDLLVQVYDTQRAVNPFNGAEYDERASRYVGNGLCNYDEIIEKIINYGSDGNVDEEIREEGEASGESEGISNDSINCEETGSSEYILPESNTRYLDASEVSSLGEEKLQRAINEIYARHGRVFTTPENDTYFRSKSWYQPVEGKTDEQIEAELNDFEKANVDLMNSYR